MRLFFFSSASRLSKSSYICSKAGITPPKVGYFFPPKYLNNRLQEKNSWGEKSSKEAQNSKF